jgi:hypothetical protein
MSTKIIDLDAAIIEHRATQLRREITVLAVWRPHEGDLAGQRFSSSEHNPLKLITRTFQSRNRIFANLDAASLKELSASTLEVRYGRFDNSGRSLVDHVARPTRLVREHRARKHELFDLERLKPAPQLSGAANGDLFVERIRFAREIEVSCKVNDRSNARSIGGLHTPQACVDSFFRSQVDAHTLRSRRWLTCRRLVEANKPEPAGELVDESGADKAGTAGYDDDVPLFRHFDSLLLASRRQKMAFGRFQAART